jgi:hypothetical protein
MTTLTDLNAALVSQIDAVSGVENVYGYTRYIADWSGYLGLFRRDGGDINGWWVTLANPSITTAADVFGANLWTYHWLITGIMGVQDSANSEAVILAQAEAILATLHDETTLGVVGVTVGDLFPQLRVVEHRQFGSTLAHYCEITLDVPVQVSF